MSLLNLRKVLISDNVEEAFDKVNWNFEQIGLNGGGPMGPAGITGSTGIPGGPGPIGPTGPAGQNGQKWYLDTSNPPNMSSQSPASGDETLWFNTTTGEIFEWNGTTWVSIGSFGAANYWSRTGTNIFNANYTNSLVLSDEASGVGTAPIVSNPSLFLLKLNSTNGSHIQLVNGATNDADSVTIRLDPTDFFIDSAGSGVTMNLQSQKDIKMIASDNILISADSNLNTNSTANTTITVGGALSVPVTGTITVNSTANDTFFGTRVAISAGSRFTPSEQLVVGQVSNPGNISVWGNNAGTGGKVLLGKDTKTFTLDTHVMNASRIGKFPDFSGEVALLREFNNTLYNNDWVKTENNWSFGWTLGAGSTWVYRGAVGLNNPPGNGGYDWWYAARGGSNGKGQLWNTNTTCGAQIRFTSYYKIIGNLVHFKWSMRFMPQFKGGGPGTFPSNQEDQLIGFHIPLPFDASKTSANHIQAASKLETKTYDNGTPLKYRHIHRGSCVERTGWGSITGMNLTQKNFLYQVKPEWSPSGDFAGSKLVILHNDYTFDYDFVNTIEYEGECFLEMQPDNYPSYTDPEDIDLKLVLYNPQPARNSSGGVPRGTIVAFRPDVYTAFDANGYGLNSEIIGWKICDGRDNTPDLRGRFLVGAIQLGYGSYSAPSITNSQVNPSVPGNPNYGYGWIGGESVHYLSTGEIPSHNHGIFDPGHSHGVTEPFHSHSQTVVQSGGGWDGGSLGSLPFAVESGYSGLFNSTGSAKTNLSINSSGTNISINNTGGNGSHNNLPPYHAVIYLIKLK